MPSLRDWSLALTPDDVLRGQGADPAIQARRPALRRAAERALASGRPLLRPTVVYRQLRIERREHWRLELEGGGALTGELVGRGLGPAQAVIVMIATLGPALEAQAARHRPDDPLAALALDGLGNAAVEALASAACRGFAEQAGEQGLETTTPLSPGLEGWPVETGQPEIFNLLAGEAPPELGLRLLPSGFIIPQKSLSLAIGVGQGLEAAGTPCAYCARRTNCRYQDRL
jgi:hypothetical protein